MLVVCLDALFVHQLSKLTFLWGCDDNNDMVSMFCFSLAQPDSIFAQGTYTACDNAPA